MFSSNNTEYNIFNQLHFYNERGQPSYITEDYNDFLGKDLSLIKLNDI